MLGFLAGLVIIGLLMLAVINGRRRGLVAVAASFLAFLLSLTLAGWSYHALGGALASLFHTADALANVVAYVLILVLAQFALLLGAHQLVRRLPRQTILSRANRSGGMVMALVETAFMIAITLMVAAGLPLNTGAVTQSPVAKPFVLLGQWTQGVVGSLPGQDLTDTLGLLTVDPESERTVMLGFTTTRVSVNEQAERQMLELVNRERSSRGLPALTMNDSAREVARAHSRDMMAQGYFSHKGLDSSTPYDRMRAGNVEFHVAGENIALAPTLELAHNGLMNSPGHRANILSKDYKTVGIGVIESREHGLMFTQDFTD